jgi:hypothetical protein
MNKIPLKPLTYIVLIYLCLILLYTLIFIKQSPTVTLLASNELGDFLAGVFAPLAFMFLYLGYRQQQEGLKQNTEVLRLQVQELQENVKQQKLLQENSEENLALLKSKIESENKKELILAQPFFHISCKEFKEIENTDSLGWELEISNSGKIARNVQVDTRKVGSIGFINILTSVFKGDEVYKINIPTKHPDDFLQESDKQYISGYTENRMLVLIIKIDYLDEFYNKNYQTFKSGIYKKIEGTGYLISQFELIERSF